MISTTKLLKAIRKKCIECSAGDRSEVLHCGMTDCPLYQYRMGIQAEGKKRSDDEKR